MIGGNTGLPVESVGNMNVLWSKMSETRGKKKKREKVKNQSRGRDVGDVGRALIMSGGKEILVNPIHRNSR